LSINDLQHLPWLEPAGLEDLVGAKRFNYNTRCTRTTVASPGTGCTVNLSFRANVSIGTLPAITEPSIVL
jgi:hypothetical protein